MGCEPVLVGGRPCDSSGCAASANPLLSFRPSVPRANHQLGREIMGRCIGLDLHRDFAQVAIWENGRVRDGGRVATSPERLREFATTLRRSDRVAL